MLIDPFMHWHDAPAADVMFCCRQYPTAAPTDEPTAAPTAYPTDEPTASPTPSPTEEPTAAPTEVRAISRA
jgi:hypothetical protein